MATDRKELWIGWARDAIARFPMPEVVDDSEDVANDMVDIATAYADMMLEEYEDRFVSGRSKRSKRRKADDEDEE